MDSDEAFQGRIDLALSSGGTLLIVEFMRPGLTVDDDHVYRFEMYVRSLRRQVKASRSEYSRVSGLLVADRLEKKDVLLDKIESLRRDDMDATDWVALLERAKRQWKEHYDLLSWRAPNDSRLGGVDQHQSEAGELGE